MAATYLNNTSVNFNYSVTQNEIDQVIRDIKMGMYSVLDLLMIGHTSQAIDGALESGKLFSPFTPKVIAIETVEVVQSSVILDPAIIEYNKITEAGFEAGWQKFIAEAELESEVASLELAMLDEYRRAA